MVSVTHPTHDIEVTAERLQEDSACLRIQKQALERELAAIVALPRLGATGSQHLRVLDACPSCREAGPDSEARRPANGDCLHLHLGRRSRRAGARTRTVLLRPGTTRVRPAHRADHGALRRSRRRRCTGLDIAAALGRDSDSGSINGVRSTLERHESATNKGVGSAESTKATHR